MPSRTHSAGMDQATLPSDIEVFRAGRHVDDQGVARTFTRADLVQMADGYDPALHEAPLTVGHPAHDLPAYGWVRRLAVDGDRLVLREHRDVEPRFAEMVRERRFPKRSTSLYSPDHPSNPKPGGWYVRHIGFLGAQPPGVKGLKEIAFAEDKAAVCVSFSEAGEAGQSTQEQEQMEKDKDAVAAAQAEAAKEREAREKASAAAQEANNKLAQFAEAQRRATHAAHVSFAEEQVKAGKLLPKDKGAAVAVLDLLAAGEPVEFAEGDTTKKVQPVEWLKSLISGAKPQVQFGEFAVGTVGDGAAGGEPLTDDELDKRARAYAAKHVVSYSEAVAKVASFTAS